MTQLLYHRLIGKPKQFLLESIIHMDIVYHYPPELFQLLTDTIPLLCRSKRDLLLFFRGAGVSNDLYSDLAIAVQIDRDSISKFEIASRILKRLNDRGEASLRERREVLKRVVEFEDFSTCWPDDQLKAKGLVSEVRRVINVKDSFTRMRQEREREKRKSKEKYEKEIKRKKKREEDIRVLREQLYSLFGEVNAQYFTSYPAGHITGYFKRDFITS